MRDNESSRQLLFELNTDTVTQKEQQKLKYLSVCVRCEEIELFNIILLIVFSASCITKYLQ